MDHIVIKVVAAECPKRKSIKEFYNCIGCEWFGCVTEAVGGEFEVRCLNTTIKKIDYINKEQ